MFFLNARTICMLVMLLPLGCRAQGLQETVQIALAHYPSITAAKYKTQAARSDITRAKGRFCNLIMYRCNKSSTSTTFSANQTMPQRLTVAGVPCPMSRTSNITRILGSSSNRSPLGSVKVLLSSRTEFKLSTQSGSKSPSKTIQCLCDGADDADMRRSIAVKMPSLHSRVLISSLPAEQMSCKCENCNRKYRKDLPS